MKTRLMKTSRALSLPLAFVLVSSVAGAAVQEDRNESSGKAESKTVTTQKSGNTTTRTATATATRPDGKTRTSTDTWTREGNTVKHEGETTYANGKTSTRQSTTTKDGNTVTREATQTGPNGGKRVVYSIHEWHPELGSSSTTRTETRTPPTTTRRSLRGTGSTPRERAEEIK